MHTQAFTCSACVSVARDLAPTILHSCNYVTYTYVHKYVCIHVHRHTHTRTDTQAHRHADTLTMITSVVMDMK